MKKILFMFILLSLAAQVIGANNNGLQYLPDNDLRFPVQGDNKSRLKSNSTKQDYLNMMKRFKKMYDGEFRQADKKVKFVDKWRDDKVNAYIELRFTRTVKVRVFGGLARHPLLTRDGLAGVFCHEIGHIIGGKPRHSGLLLTWASAEGQSDYFASLRCMREYFQHDDNESIVQRLNVDPEVERQCKDNALCKRISMASKSIIDMIVDVVEAEVVPEFDTPDMTVVEETITGVYPSLQCRLDTFLSGALEASRPSCWFKDAFPKNNF
ncbi:MAG: M48 family metalloprotease [Bacteriovoracaceae bacterium]|nr:M48 family metalloprotease [Bacteriovoracaceae bacterium]